MIGIIGGTGDFGRGLAKRLVLSGRSVFIGSRDESKGVRIAEQVSEAIGTDRIKGGSNTTAAKCEYIYITLPSSSLQETLEKLKPQLEDKIVVECCVSLKFGKFIKVIDHEGKSTYELVREILDNSKVASALKTVSAYKLGRIETPLDETDFIMSLSDEAFEFAAENSRVLGLDVIRVRGKTHALTLERMTALAIQLNKDHPNSHFGFKLTR